MKNVYKFKSSLILLLILAGFTGKSQVATVVTDSIYTLANTYAYFGGKVTAIGGSAVTERGVCWSTTNTPSLANKVADASGGLGAYIDLVMTPLTPGGTYYVWAYAINSSGTAFSSSTTITTFATGSENYQCDAENDYLVDDHTYQFDVIIYSISDLNPLHLNNYQLAFEVWNVGSTAGTLTGTYQTGTSQLEAGRVPATSMIFRSDNSGGAHFDAVIAGPPANSTAEVIPSTGKRIGTFRIVYNSGGTPTAFPKVRLNMIFDNDVLGKTVIYSWVNTGPATVVTNMSAHSPNTIAATYPYTHPMENHVLNAVNWDAADVGGTSNWGTAANWVAEPASLSTPPSSTAYVAIPGTGLVYYPVIASGTNATANDLLIGSGGSVTIQSGGTLTVNGTLTNSAGNSGIVIQSGSGGSGSLIHNTATVNATVQRYVSGNKYHMVSIPLTAAAGLTSNLFLDSYLYSFDDSQYADPKFGWVNNGTSTTNPLSNQQGYMIYYPGTEKTYNFTGPLNNGSLSATLSYTAAAPYGPDPTPFIRGMNLVPNPYPSAINWRSATGWSRTNIDSAIYIWNNGVYATYASGVGANGGSQFIASGQSFFVHANASGPSLSMDNNVRIHNSVSFLKQNEIIPNVLRIVASADSKTFETVIRFNEFATANYDASWDACKIGNDDSYPLLSSLSADNINLSINCLPLAGGDITVPLIFNYGSTGEVTFTVSGIDSFDKNGPIFLEDQTLSKMIDLRSNPVYNFNHQAGNPSDRFVLHFSGVNGTSKINSVDGKVFINNGQIFFEVPGMNGKTTEVALYNLLGQNIYTVNKRIDGITSIKAPSDLGVYILKISSENQHFVTKIVNK